MLLSVMHYGLSDGIYSYYNVRRDGLLLLLLALSYDLRPGPPPTRPHVCVPTHLPAAHPPTPPAHASFTSRASSTFTLPSLPPPPRWPRPPEHHPLD